MRSLLISDRRAHGRQWPRFHVATNPVVEKWAREVSLHGYEALCAKVGPSPIAQSPFPFPFPLPPPTLDVDEAAIAVGSMPREVASAARSLCNVGPTD